MNPNLAYVLGTLLSWLGWFFVFRFVLLAFQALTHAPGIDLTRVQRGLVTVGVVAASLFLLGAAMPMHLPDNGEAPAWRLPLVWFVMPWTGWLAAISAGAVLLRLTQSAMALGSVERVQRIKSAAIWGVAGFAATTLYRSDPDSKIEVLKGGIPFAPSTAVTLILLAVAATFAMTLAGRATATRGYAKAVVTQLTLLAGTVVFGLPFAFLLITSFKEDRDMASPNGIVWVPKVQETVPYMDPRDPVYEGKYNGATVQGTVDRRNPDGTLRIDIVKPMAIRGVTFDARPETLHEVPVDAKVVTAKIDGVPIKGMVVEDLDDGRQRVQVLQPASMKGREATLLPAQTEPVRHVGLRWQNYPEALDYLPPETDHGLVFLKNTLVIVILSVVGTILSSSLVAYAFSRMQFPGRGFLFTVLLSTMMLPGAVTLMPQFLIFRDLGWIDTLKPLWVPAFFGSAFNIFLLRQFFMQIPMELEDAAKIDGCSYLRAFWDVMVPQVKPALAVIAIWTFMGAWNNFMGPLIYVGSPENMPLSYALQMFSSDRSGEPGLLMAFATMCMLPVLLLFFFAQRYFVEGVTLSGMGGR